MAPAFTNPAIRELTDVFLRYCVYRTFPAPDRWHEPDSIFRPYLAQNVLGISLFDEGVEWGCCNRSSEVARTS